MSLETTRDPDAASANAYRVLVDIGARLHGDPGALVGVLEFITKAATELLGTEIAWLALADREAGLIQPVVLEGFRLDSFLDKTVPIFSGIGGKALASRSTVGIEDVENYASLDTAVRESFEHEDIKSLLCAPMIKDNQLVGALYVARRFKSVFTTAEHNLLQALAGQASIGISNRRLSDRLRDQNKLLESSSKIHRELTQASLGGIGLKGVAETLERLLGCPVRLIPEVPGVAPVLCPEDADISAPNTVRRIMAHGQRLGTIEIFHTGDLTPLQTQAIEHGVTILALELVKLESAAEVEFRLSGDLLDDLLETPVHEYARLRGRAAHLGIDLQKNYQVLALGIAEESEHAEAHLLRIVRKVITDILSSRTNRVMTSKREHHIVVALTAPMNSRSLYLIDAVRLVFTGSGTVVTCGIGPMADSIDVSYRSAVACLHLAQRSMPNTTNPTISFDDLGILRFMLDAPNLNQTTEMVLASLKPLMDHDRSNRVPLLPTLSQFVASDGHYEQTAKRLFIGTSTLKYRLAKIIEVLGLDPRDGTTRFQIRLAFELLKFLEARGVEITVADSREQGPGSSGAHQI